MKKILFYFTLLVLRLISLLPMVVIRVIGISFGILGYYIAIKRRNIGIKNLSLCFPAMTVQEKHKIIKEHFKYLLTSGFEYSLLFYASSTRIRRIVKVKNPELIDKYYHHRPIILLCPHFVGLDLCGLRLSLDYSGISMFTKQKNDIITERIRQARIRFMKHRGGNVLARNDGLRPVIKKLRTDKEIFYYLPDQDLGERDSLYVPFFAHPTCATVNALPKLASLTNAVVIPLAIYRVGNHYEIELSEPFDDYPTSNLENDVIRMNKFIESAIDKNIAQYFWLHKRFKSQPNIPRGSIYNN